MGRAGGGAAIIQIFVPEKLGTRFLRGRGGREKAPGEMGLNCVLFRGCGAFYCRLMWVLTKCSCCCVEVDGYRLFQRLLTADLKYWLDVLHVKFLKIKQKINSNFKIQFEAIPSNVRMLFHFFNYILL